MFRGNPFFDSLLYERTKVFGHIEVGIEFPSHPLHSDERLGEEHQVGLELYVIGGDDLDELQEHPPDLDVLERKFIVAVDKF